LCDYAALTAGSRRSASRDHELIRAQGAVHDPHVANPAVEDLTDRPGVLLQRFPRLRGGQVD
jgi:hypothetical protein